MGFSEPVKVWHHQKYGEGPRVFVGLHGWNGSHRSFDSLLPYLPDDVTFYALDLPGYGGSSPPNSWSLSGIVSALQEQLAALDLPAFTLVGSCSGALFGMWAMREPSPFLVERVVLIDAFGFMPWYFRLFLLPGLGHLFYYSTFANPLGRWITNWSLRNKRMEDTNLTQAFSRAPVSIPFHYLRAMGAMGDSRSFQHVDVPVDIAFGESSFGAVIDSVERWQQNWPSASVCCLKGAGHLSVQEKPDLLAKVLFDS